MWFSKYKDNIEPKVKKLKYESVLPPTNFRIPSRPEQFKIFSKRNFLSKISNRQYVLINLLEAPVLAFILGYFSKYSPENTYEFSHNINLPAYLFMSVVVALFLGLTISAQEIYKDRQILERESFLNLSRISYINSKVFFLFTLSAIQTLSFALLGNYILEIKGMTLYYWAILFSTACFANMVGLNISSALNSVINIYILIPFILVPQLLLGGAMIKFDELHHTITNQKHVPVVGDLMASRWAYEAIAVAQFRYNKYERHFFEADRTMSINVFQRSYLIPELQNINKSLLRDSLSRMPGNKYFAILRNDLQRMSEEHGVKPFAQVSRINAEQYTTDLGNAIEDYLEEAKDYFKLKYQAAVAKRDSVYNHLKEKIGRKKLLQMEKDYENEILESTLRNNTNLKRIFVGEDQLIQKKDPIFMKPYSKIGRAHFYSSSKIIGPVEIPTYYFNMAFLWLMTLVMYLTLLDNTLKKFLDFFQTPPRSRDEKKKTYWSRLMDKLQVYFKYPVIYRRALRIKRSS
jgi:hypothetical protein